MKINSDLVKQLRCDKQWSQEQLGEACGLNLHTIQRLETTGKGSMESVRALAAVCHSETSHWQFRQIVALPKRPVIHFYST